MKTSQIDPRAPEQSEPETYTRELTADELALVSGGAAASMRAASFVSSMRVQGLVGSAANRA